MAVSGGVDSIVLLDQMVYEKNRAELIVAHFDHGIRASSADDAKFVANLAREYGVKFEMKRVELGAETSEELARDERYKFLRAAAKKYDATLVTAHHLDDLVETIAINLVRGTGWRGLAVLDAPGVLRPNIEHEKAENLAYAAEHHLKWREDETNASDRYLRNRIRAKTMILSVETKHKLLELWKAQRELKRVIGDETKRLLPESGGYSRYFFTMIDEFSACELLREVTRGRLTRPQLQSVLMAIKTYQPHTVYQAGGGVEITFSSRIFQVNLIK